MLARAAGPVQNTGPSIKDYINRPRPSMDEFKQMVAEKDKKNAALEMFEEMQTKNFREELDKYREDMFRRQEMKAKEEKKKSKKDKKDKKDKKKKRKHSSSDESDSKSKEKKRKKHSKRESSDGDSKSKKKAKEKKAQSSPVKLSDFFKQSDDS